MPETVACNMCGSLTSTPRPSLTRFVELQSPYEVRQCANCSLIYMSPRPTPDELIAMYLREPYFSEDNADRGASRLDFYGTRMLRLERARPGRGQLLGIGCLEGGYALEVAKSRGWQVHGVESSEILADYARKHLNFEVETVHGWDLSALEDGRFDAVYTHSFEHFSDPRYVLEQVRRVLRPDGIFMVEVPYQFHSFKDRVRRIVVGLLGERRRLIFKNVVPYAFHLYYFSPVTLRRLLAQQGFDTTELRTYLPAHPVYLRNPQGRWMQETLYAIGGLFGSGPSIEAIARPSVS